MCRHGFQDALSLGWELPVEEKDGRRQVAIKHSWDKMVERVDGYIRNLNFGYRVRRLPPIVGHLVLPHLRCRTRCARPRCSTSMRMG